MFYVLNKEKGISSFKAIKNFASENNIKKIGHTGTLDPLATGMLLVATDDDTKLIDYIDKGNKTYIATMQLGKTSDTFDIDGNVISTECNIPNEHDVINAIMSFIGKQKQTPPSFSAKKINGVRSYKLAREGHEVKLKKINIEVYNISEIKRENDQTYSFEIVVSRGTYIRSIISDIGSILKCGAIMSDLARIKIGDIEISESDRMINILSIFTLPVIELDQIDINNLLIGNTEKVNMKDGMFGLIHNDEIYGVVKINKNILSVKKLFGKRIERFINESI